MGLTKCLRHLPNALTISRLAATPVLGLLVYHSHYSAALPLFAWCGATDVADGWLARRLNCQSRLGSVLDPLADKVLVGTLTVAFIASGSIAPLTGWLVLGRDAGLMLGSLWITQHRRISLSQIQINPFMSSKINTALQLALLGLCLWEGYRRRKEYYAGIKAYLEKTVQFTTLLSGVSYLIWHRRAFKIV